MTFETYDQSDEETDLTNEKAMTNTNTNITTKTMTNTTTKTITKTNTFREHTQRAISETFDL